MRFRHCTLIPVVLLNAVSLISAGGCQLPPPAAPEAKHVALRAQDGWEISGNLYDHGDRGLVLVHGGLLTKESWTPQVATFVNAGFTVLAIDLRGFGESKGGLNRPPATGKQWDVMAAVRYLRERGAKTVFVVGGSMGGDAAARATVECAPEEIERVVMIASGGIETPETMKGRKLFIACRGDLQSDGKPRLDEISRQFAKAPQPKKLVVLEGAAHAQFAFASPQGDQLMREILRFLVEP